MSILLGNTQSVKNKDLCLRQYITEVKADLTVLTETWITNDDTLWLMSTELNNNGLKMDVVNRKGGKGGGLAIIHKDNIKTKKLKGGAVRSFEYAIWQCLFKSISIHILAIYRPPYSEKNKTTIKMFIEDISEFLDHTFTEVKNIIIMGDFNIHINNQNDTEAQVLKEAMESLGLEQHVTEPTHKAGNILDQIYTEIGGKIQINRCENRDYISDHCLIHSVINVPKENIIRKTITYRKYKNIDKVQLTKDLELDVSETVEVDKIVNIFEEKVRLLMDQHAPETKK